MSVVAGLINTNWCVTSLGPSLVWTEFYVSATDNKFYV